MRSFRDRTRTRRDAPENGRHVSRKSEHIHEQYGRYDPVSITRTYFVKQTAGTITVTLTTSVAAVYVVGHILYNNSTATGARSVNKISGGATANAFTASQSLTTGGSNTFNIRTTISANATTNSTLTINFTESAGTIIPLQGSYYKVTQLPSENSGIFS